MRDPMGLGFSIAGGKGAEPYIEGSESVFISKIAEGGPASRDGKIRVGDRLIQVDQCFSTFFAMRNPLIKKKSQGTPKLKIYLKSQITFSFVFIFNFLQISKKSHGTHGGWSRNPRVRGNPD